MTVRLAVLSSLAAASLIDATDAHARSRVPLDELEARPDAATPPDVSDGTADPVTDLHTRDDVQQDARGRPVPTATTQHAELHTPSAAVTPRWFRLEGGIGVRWGSFLVDNVDATGSVKQLHLDGGIRLRGNRTLLYAQYAIQSMQIPLDELAARSGTPVAIGNGRGLVHRLAAHGRYSFGRAGDDDDGGLDLFADAGIGVQHLRWDAGGAWTRPDLQLALGIGGLAMGEKQHGGLTFSIVLTLAPRNDVDGAGMACGGPCDYATAPTGLDRSFMFDLTLQFGK